MELVHAIHDLGLRQHWQLLVNTSLAIKRIHGSALARFDAQFSIQLEEFFSLASN
jgi:hypothetical protein